MSQGLFTYFSIYEPAWIVPVAFAIYKACVFINMFVDLHHGENSFRENFAYLRRLKLSASRRPLRRERPLLDEPMTPTNV
jgi:hypothetical protein